ncbi:60S ribosomal protein L6, mitochondrial [Capsicum annuum]|uniref:60S ribosomal protein L6, mitochondrial n=1 Tax=Capsicum annuum TaxID=4072 RepID=A0A2G2ZMI9_CAPAN|nr:60S ribosomal protein L6, mitochondrial [Capsicum annuum]PHT83207.1 60S ribosomal protein L6, mitochondrial [Capsicum annuum]
MEAKFFCFLKIVGVGFKAKAESQGRLLYLKLGCSHEVELTVLPAVRVFCFKPNIICCAGIDKERVHQFAASVRSCKPPEVHEGKGLQRSESILDFRVADTKIHLHLLRLSIVLNAHTEKLTPRSGTWGCSEHFSATLGGADTPARITGENYMNGGEVYSTQRY